MFDAVIESATYRLIEENKDQLVDLGLNLGGVKIGLVVPSYMDIDSIEGF